MVVVRLELVARDRLGRRVRQDPQEAMVRPVQREVQDQQAARAVRELPARLVQQGQQAELVQLAQRAPQARPEVSVELAARARRGRLEPWAVLALWDRQVRPVRSAR